MQFGPVEPSEANFRAIWQVCHRMIEQYDREKKAELEVEIAASKTEGREPKSIVHYEYDSTDMYMIVIHAMVPTAAELVSYAFLSSDEIQGLYEARSELRDGYKVQLGWSAWLWQSVFGRRTVRTWSSPAFRQGF